MLATPMTLLTRMDEKAVDDCEIILDCYSRTWKAKKTRAERGEEEGEFKNNHEWAHGRKHIFLSEGARQQLERLRDERRQGAATCIQSAWRGWNYRKRKSVKPRRNDNVRSSAIGLARSSLVRDQQRPPRPQPISGTPPPLPSSEGQAADQATNDRCDFKTIQQTCALFGLDLVR